MKIDQNRPMNFKQVQAENIKQSTSDESMTSKETGLTMEQVKQGYKIDNSESDMEQIHQRVPLFRQD